MYTAHISFLGKLTIAALSLCIYKINMFECKHVTIFSFLNRTVHGVGNHTMNAYI